MVRIYTRKTKRGSSYTKEALQRAVSDVKRQVLTVRKAAKTYKIPYSTILNHTKGYRGKKSSSFGRSTIIPVEEERKLADGLRTLGKWGWGLTRKEVLEVVGRYVTEKKMKTPFKNNVPGEDWFLGFKKRHRLSLKKPQSLEFARKKATDPFVIQNYFDLLEQTLIDLGLHDKPQQIYNIDETNFCLDPSKSKVVGQKNVPSARITSGPGRENITVLMGGNANGDKLPPLVVFKGKNIWEQWIPPENQIFPNMGFVSSENGWMETELFCNYFNKNFLRNCVPQRPILLIFDGHSTHLDIKLIESAVANDVTILKLPPHSSHLLQPMDLAVFRSLKCAWDAKLVKWQRNHIGQKLPKKEFSILISEIWTDCKEENLKSGFQKAGIFPFNRHVIPEDKFDPESLRRFKQSKDLTADLNPIEDLNAEINPIEDLNADINPTEHLNANINPTAGPSHSDAGTENPLKEKESADKISVSFESLLLESLKQKPVPDKQKRKKIATGAEVITAKLCQQITKKRHLNEKEKEQKKLEKVKNKARKQRQISTDSEEDIIISEKDDSDEDLTFDKYLQQQQDQIEEAEAEESCEINNIQVGKWALVKFASKRKIMYFVGQIIEVNEGEPLIKFTRRKEATNSKTVFSWSVPDDVCLVDSDDVVKILPEPTLGRRGELIFNISFQSYNLH